MTLIRLGLVQALLLKLGLEKGARVPPLALSDSAQLSVWPFNATLINNVLVFINSDVTDTVEVMEYTRNIIF